MEKEPICYISENGKKIDTLKKLWEFRKKPLFSRQMLFMEQKLVHVQIGFLDEKWWITDDFKKKWYEKFFAKLIKRIYINKLQSKMWEILLANQNVSMHPAFCSKKVYETFAKEKTLSRELWINESIPPAVVEKSLCLFLKRECYFRKDTKVFVIDNKDIDVEELLFPYCSRLNYLQFLSGESDCHGAFIDEMYEESGLAIAITTKTENAKEADILIDLSKEELIAVSDIKKGCIYFDGFSDYQKEKRIRNCRNDVTYISSRNYLDRALKSTL